MTPPARLSAAIEVLDLYLGGQPVEKALTNWGRRSRFAGSKDRAAVRDIVFDCLRRRTSYALWGHGLTGRGLVLGSLKNKIEMAELDRLFSGEGHAPAPLSEDERTFRKYRLSADALLDMPNWLLPELHDAFPNRDEQQQVCDALKSRAEVFLRVNLSRLSRENAAQMLADEEITTEPHPLAAGCLRVTGNPRRVAHSHAYTNGFVELQDAASQAVCAGLPEAARMLDYCAGGGGKVLAYGDRVKAELFAHDANPARLRDLGPRAARAGLKITQLSTQDCVQRAPFDLVLCDVPCSGSGAWRRSPEGKWALTAQRLGDLIRLQAKILKAASALVAPNGILAYATCSMLISENSKQVRSLIGLDAKFDLIAERQYLPSEGGDGFYVAHLKRQGSCPSASQFP